MLVLGVKCCKPFPRDFPRRQIELEFAVTQADDARKACGYIDLMQRGDEGCTVFPCG